MWEGNPGYQLDVAIAMHEYECVCMCVYVCVLAAGDLEHSAARCNNPQAELDSEPMSRLRLSKDVAKATTPTHQAVSGTGPAYWAGSAACNNQQQQRAAGACSGSVCLGGHWTAEPFSKWPSNCWPWTQPVHWLLQPRADGGETGAVQRGESCTGWKEGGARVSHYSQGQDTNRMSTDPNLSQDGNAIK